MKYCWKILTLGALGIFSLISFLASLPPHLPFFLFNRNNNKCKTPGFLGFVFSLVFYLYLWCSQGCVTFLKATANGKCALPSLPPLTQTANVEEYFGSNSGNFHTAVSGLGMQIHHPDQQNQEAIHGHTNLMSISLPSKQCFATCLVNILLMLGTNETIPNLGWTSPEAVLPRSSGNGEVLEGRE